MTFRYAMARATTPAERQRGGADDDGARSGQHDEPPCGRMLPGLIGARQGPLPVMLGESRPGRHDSGGQYHRYWALM
jgi:hypothetical protein